MWLYGGFTTYKHRFPYTMTTRGPIVAPWQQEESPLDRESFPVFEIFAIKYDFFRLTHGTLVGCNVPYCSFFPIHFRYTQDKPSYQDGKLSHSFGPITGPSVDMLL